MIPPTPLWYIGHMNAFIEQLLWSFHATRLQRLLITCLGCPLSSKGINCESRLCRDKCAISPVWCTWTTRYPPTVTFQIRTKIFRLFKPILHWPTSCFSKNPNLHEAFANVAVAKVRVLTIILLFWNIIRSESHFSARLLPISQL